MNSWLFCSLLFLSGCIQSAESNCIAGRYEGDNNACKNCPVGFYQNEINTRYCRSCLMGQYQNIEAQTACIECPIGRKFNVEISPVGQTPDGCVKCPSGHYQKEKGRSVCFFCPPATYSDQEGSFHCKSCPPMKYSMGYRAVVECADCPTGYHTPVPPATGCSIIPQGKYFIPGTNHYTVHECNKGYYCEGGSNHHTRAGVQTNCPPGTYAGEKGLARCIDCAPGFFASSPASTKCTPCSPDEYQPESNATACIRVQPGYYRSGSTTEAKCPAGTVGSGGSALCQGCDVGYYISTPGQTTCLECPNGYVNRNDENTFCTQCDAGRYFYNDAGNSATCQRCAAGRVSTYGQNSCEKCAAGYYSNGDHSSCVACSPGKYGDQEFQMTVSSCKVCSPGTYSSALGVSSAFGCNNCSTGKYSKEEGRTSESFCTECIVGKYQQVSGSTSCRNCPKGTYTNTTGSVSCIPCSPGKFSSSEGSSECEACPSGYLQSDPQQFDCDKVKSGAIVVTGGSASLIVPKGSKIDASDPSGFSACPAGTIGNDPPNGSCAHCVTGQSSSKGFSECHPCDKGRYSKTFGGVCEECPAGQFQDQSALPSVSCLNCPVGWNQPKTGSAACISLNWKTIEECSTKDNMYLNDSSLDPSNWDCELCPIGGDCSTPVTWNDIEPKFGWWKIPENERDPAADLTEKVFAECLYPSACHARYDNKTCATNLGFRNNSRLCQACDEGFSRTSRSSCIACTNSGGGSSVIISVTVMALSICFTGLNFLRMKSFRRFNAKRRRKSLHSTIKRILLSHVQMLSIVLGLSVPWPSLLKIILTTASSVASFSEGVNRFQCLYADMGYAEFYNYVLVFAALGPILIAAILAAYWFVLIHVLCHKLKCGVRIYRGPLCPSGSRAAATTAAAMAIISEKKKEKEQKKKEKEKKKKGAKENYTDADAFISSVVLLWFLTLPSLLFISTSSLKCYPVGNKMYVFINLEKECMKDDHLWLSLLVAIPTIIFYGVVLPVFFMLQLRRAGPARLTDPSLMLRWGMLHSGYREKKYWWEVIVLIRKYIIIGLVTFQSQGTFQLHVALGVLIVALHAHDSQRPFGHNHIDPVNSVLHRYEMVSLLILLFMLWCAIFFSLDLCTNYDPFWCSLMVTLTIGSNVFLVLGLLAVFSREWAKRKKVKKKLRKNIEKLKSFWRKNSHPNPSDKENSKTAATDAKDGCTKKTRRLSSRELMYEMSKMGANWKENELEKEDEIPIDDQCNPMHGSVVKVKETVSEALNTGDWIRHYDENTHMWYLENILTKETKWE